MHPKTKRAVNYLKYDYYLRSAQAPAADAEIMTDIYRKVQGRSPRILREDFCGTGALCCEWVRLGSKRVAIGVDLDPEPLRYGEEKLLHDLSPAQKARINLELGDVFHARHRADIICALNFSYFIFHDRKTLIHYFRAARQSLNKRGLLILDGFGGSEYYHPRIERRRHGSLLYVWEMKWFDVMSHRAEFAIHFKPKKGRWMKNAFTYSWRMWSIPELRDILAEAGFKKSRLFWEGSDKDGFGNGRFREVTRVNEHCHSWVAYIVAEA